MAAHANHTSIQTAFTARAAVGGFAIAPTSKLPVTVPAGTTLTISRPRVPLATS